MCRITQTPFLFAACSHLCVLSTVESCDDVDHPNGLPLYCGPAEWNLVTVLELETLSLRCKNCRAGPRVAPDEGDKLPAKPPTLEKPPALKRKPTKVIPSSKTATATRARAAKPAKAAILAEEHQVVAEETHVIVEEVQAKAALYNMSVEEYKKECAIQLGIIGAYETKRAEVWDETPETA
ncbi:hypothetical protein B0T11DRAFT_301966 [Plectosphaerella cucumerina]|uniref:Uncharacterized protein n=1 Tax=Plectosphaerella cucumerina TaxID=40658 RepID=A0A8K0WZA3_9PEZI|nr:hypothetical protein B0T11DRAFT_301966 [Plectosphaerella cucumerina]